MASKSSLDLSCKWKQITPKQEGSQIPLERSSHAVSLIDDTLYLFGGENTARIPIDSSIYAFGISENQPNFGIWQKIEVLNDAPAPRIAHSQAVIGNKIYIFGGRQGISMEEMPLNDLHYFDVDTKTWTEVSSPDETFPSARSFHQMVSVGSCLFVFGGCGKTGRLSDLYEFNTLTSKWSKHSNEFKDSDQNVQTISGRGGASLIASKNGDKLFLVAGFAGQEMDDIYIYDLKSKFWKHLSQTLPTPRSVCISTMVTLHEKHNLILIFGGEVNPSDRGHEGAGGFSSDVVLINEDTFEIKTLSKSDCAGIVDWPTPRGWSSGSSGNGNNHLIIFGGLSGDDKNPLRLNDLWICTIDKN